MSEKYFDIEMLVSEDKALRTKLAKEWEVSEQDVINEPEIESFLQERINMEGKEVVSMHNEIMCNSVTKWRGKYYLDASELGFSGPHHTLQEALDSDLILGATYNDLIIESNTLTARSLKRFSGFSADDEGPEIVGAKKRKRRK